MSTEVPTVCMWPSATASASIFFICLWLREELNTKNVSCQQLEQLCCRCSGLATLAEARDEVTGTFSDCVANPGPKPNYCRHNEHCSYKKTKTKNKFRFSGSDSCKCKTKQLLFCNSHLLVIWQLIIIWLTKWVNTSVKAAARKTRTYRSDFSFNINTMKSTKGNCYNTCPTKHRDVSSTLMTPPAHFLVKLF